MSEIALAAQNWDAWNIVAWITFVFPIGSLIVNRWVGMPCVATGLMAAQDLVHLIFRTIGVVDSVIEPTSVGYQTFFAGVNMAYSVMVCVNRDEIMETGSYAAPFSKFFVIFMKTVSILALIVLIPIGILERLASGIGSFLFSGTDLDFTVLDASSTFGLGSVMNAIVVLVML